MCTGMEFFFGLWPFFTCSLLRGLEIGRLMENDFGQLMITSWWYDGLTIVLFCMQRIILGALDC